MARDRTPPLGGAELASLRERLGAATGRQRLDLILDAPSPAALVAALPADELLFTIRAIGLGDAVALVQLATPGQFRSLLDLDAWRRDRFAAERALPWLRAARSGAARDDRLARRWGRQLRALDRELLLLLLRETTVVHDLRDDPDVEPGTDRVLRTPGGELLVEFTVDGLEYAAARGLVEDLIAEEPFQAARLLSALRWEAPSELEEEALRWRAGRLADLGYPPLEEALSWYARPPRQPGEPPGAPARPPGDLLALAAPGSLLARAAARLEPADREALDLQLVAAANATLVADGVDPIDEDRLREAARAARALVELGLDRLAGGDAERAAELLAATPVKRVFQEGFLRTLELAWRAERLLRSGTAGSRATPFLDPPLGELLVALARRRPRHLPAIDLPRGEWGALAAAGEPRPFLSAADLASTAAALDLAEGLARLGAELGLTPRQATGVAPRLSTLYATALANERLGRPFAPTPIPAAELAAAVEALARGGDRRLERAGEAGALLGLLLEARLAELRAAPPGPHGDPAGVTALLLAP